MKSRSGEERSGIIIERAGAEAQQTKINIHMNYHNSVIEKGKWKTFGEKLKNK